MTPQQKDLILNALRIGYDFGMQTYCRTFGVIADKNMEHVDTIRAAIKELEAMPTTTEEVK